MLNHPQPFQILHILTLLLLFQNQSIHLMALIVNIRLKNNIQNSTNHIAKLPKGHIGYTEVPITNEQH